MAVNVTDGPEAQKKTFFFFLCMPALVISAGVTCTVLAHGFMARTSYHLLCFCDVMITLNIPLVSTLAEMLLRSVRFIHDMLSAVIISTFLCIPFL